jgi:hypothetical protein
MNTNEPETIVPGWILLAWEKGDNEHDFDVLAFAAKDKYPIIDKELKLTRGYHKSVVLDCESANTSTGR